jgi:hypothetical protein
MKKLKRDLESVVKNLKLLTQKTQKISRELAKLEKAAAKPKAKPAKKKAVVKRKPVAKRKPAAKKKAVAKRKTVAKKRPAAKKVTATDKVLSIISRSKKGVNTASLKKKTGFNDSKVRSIVFRLKKAGKVKAVTKGVYVKA